MAQELTAKQQLRLHYLKPKKRLRAERLKREWTTAYTANLIGLERGQYEKKEAGEYPFHDYEMLILSDAMDLEESQLFFKTKYLKTRSKRCGIDWNYQLILIKLRLKSSSIKS